MNGIMGFVQVVNTRFLYVNTYKNLVYDLAHHESPIAQWLERPTAILEGHGFDSRWGFRKFFF